MTNEENHFGEEWRKALENAAVPPPNKIWENIELELDKKRRRPFLFFYVRPQILAGGIAAILLLVWAGIGFFQNKNNAKNQPEIALQKNKNLNEKQALNLPNLAENSPKILPENDVFSEKVAIKNYSKKPILSPNNILKNTILDNKNLENEKPINNKILANNSFENTEKKTGETTVQTGLTNSEKILQTFDNQLITNKNLSNFAINETGKQAQKQDLKTLKNKDFYVFGSRYTMNRNKLAFEDDPSETKENLAAKKSKIYVGLLSGFAPFDPNIQLDGLTTIALASAEKYALATQQTNSSGNVITVDNPTTANIPTPKNAIKAGIASQIGLNFGYKFSKNWSIESGLRYLQGNSSLNTNAYTFNDQTNARTAFLADYLLGKSTNNGVNNTIIAADNQLTNRYEYVSVPMQIGYTFFPKKRVNFSILGGFSADIFLRNTIFGTNDFVVKTTFNQSNNIYKPLIISGLGGGRVNFRLDKHLQAILGASYQQGLSSGIQTNTNLQMQLRFWGVQAGLNYRF